MDHCRKEYIKCHKKSDPFLSENEIENNKKKKDEENQNIEVKKEMNKQLDSVKKIMRNLKKSQSPEKNHYINLFLNEIKEIEISETIDLTYEKTNPKPKK